MTLIYTETRVYTGTQKCTHRHMCRLIHTDIGTHRHTYAQTYTGDTHRERCTLSCTHRHTCREPRTDLYMQTQHAHTVHTQVHQPRYTDTPRFTHTHTGPGGSSGAALFCKHLPQSCGERM